jgi:hypothetical protein
MDLPKKKDGKVDKAVDMTFPASDAPAHGKTTSTEPPARPADRKAPLVTKEQIEQAQRGDGHGHDHLNRPKGARSRPRDPAE